jgi:hypothetical protein
MVRRYTLPWITYNPGNAMEPIQGFMLYSICSAAVAAIAGRKGQSWSAYLLVMLPLGPLVVMTLSRITLGLASAPQAAALASCVPLAALLLVMLGKARKPLAA